MKIKIFDYFQIFSFVIFLTSCISNIKPTTLNEKYGKNFYVVAAIGTNQIEEKEIKATALLIEQFNTITPENIMKCEVIHPEWDKYNFDLSDKYIEYGKKTICF